MKYLSTIVLLILTYSCYGQTSVVKTNIAALAFTSLNVTYEYKVSEKLSVGSVIGYKLPKKYTVEGIADLADSDDTYTYTGEIEPEGFFFNPFLRYYTNEAMTGFYLEPFLRYYNYTYLVPYEYTKNGVTIMADADGDAKGFGGGLAVGNQWALSDKVYLDLFFGAGVAAGSAHVETSDDELTPEDYLDIKETIEEQSDASTEIDIPFFETLVDKIEADANETAAWADIDDTPFPILRFGISIGFAF